MEVEKTLRPGSDGTKRFLERFGNRLVCVRHRVDRKQGLRYTTVELIVEHRPSISPAEHHPSPQTTQPPIRVSHQEDTLGQQISAANGKWGPLRRIRLVDRTAAYRFNLHDRIA